MIKDREYAYGGHDRKGLSGVYWTRPKLEPPGGTFKTAILHGFTFCTEQEINDIVNEVIIFTPTHTTQGFPADVTTQGIPKIPGNLLQPPHQQLQPLHIVPLREADLETRTSMAQPSSERRASPAMRSTTRMDHTPRRRHSRRRVSRRRQPRLGRRRERRDAG